MWFIISLLKENKNQNISRVVPIIDDHEDTWKGFGISDSKRLEQAYMNRIQLTEKDIELGERLWNAYKNKDVNALLNLAQTKSKAFQYLPEVCHACIDMFPTEKESGKPERRIRELMKTKRSFEKVFEEFSKTEGIYGFSDVQVKRIFDRLVDK